MKRYEALVPGRDGQPPPREPTDKEKWETSPERKRQIEKEREGCPKRARHGNDNAKRKIN